MVLQNPDDLPSYELPARKPGKAIETANPALV
jgi:hypothetical protein